VIKVRPTVANVFDQLNQSLAAVNAKATPAFIRISTNDDEIVLRRIDGDGSRLIFASNSADGPLTSGLIERLGRRW